MIVLDAMEYSSDALAQAAWASSIAVISQGKSYTKTAPNALYPDSGDAELTNGTVATGDYSDANWTGWAAPVDPNVVIDLGASHVLASVRFHFYSAGVYLIGGPSTLEVYGSNNGVDFTSIGSFSIAAGNWPSGNYLGWSNTLSVSGTYRYIRFNFTHTSKWIFLSEIQINADGIKVYSESSIKQQGSYSLKLVAGQTTSLNATVTRTLSPTFNLSGQDSFKFNVRSTRTGSNFKIGLHDSGGTTTEVTPNIAAADTFQEVTLDLSAVADADKDAIDSIIFTQLNADAETTVRLDWLRALSDGEYTAADIAAAEAAQLATDQAAVLAKAAYIVDTQTILGQAGTLDMDLYVLISALPDKKYLYNGINRGDGQTGTLRASNIHTNAGAPGIDLAAGDLKKDVIVDDITGTYESSGSGDYPSPSNVLEGDTTDGVPGTYKEVGEAYVVAGVTYGPSSMKTGAYAPTPSSGDGTIIGAGLRDIYNSQLGMDAVYTPLTGDPVSLRIMLNKDIVLQPSSMDTQVVEVGTTIEAILADLGKLPVRSETFVAESTVYTVQSISRNDGMEVEIVVT